MNTETLSPLFRELIELAKEGLRNRESDSNDGVKGAQGAYSAGLAALDEASEVLPLMLDALENLPREIRAHHKMNVKKDYSLLVAEACASKALHRANAPLQLSGCFDGLRGLEINMTLEEALSASHAGQCDADVAELTRQPHIAVQLDAMDADSIRDGLRESGAWDAEELADDEANRQRAVWLAAGDIRENQPR